MIDVKVAHVMTGVMRAVNGLGQRDVFLGVRCVPRLSVRHKRNAPVVDPALARPDIWTESWPSSARPGPTTSTGAKVWASDA